MMQYKGYFGQVEFDSDAQVLRGEVIGIRDVVTFEGKSVAEVEKAFRDSVDDYLDFCKQRGDHPDRPFSGQFVLRVDPALHRRATMLAESSGKSLNAFVAECLSEVVAGKLRKRRAEAGKADRTPRPSRGFRRS